ncbi:hypothetical protein MGWOODY_Smn3479 [hydrothermal vent metagenome]|jgi:hypothetical protein|uniref:Uncharacterized protein n=1 Tax=hydrothermal vent metagenome TaxID=652676 RepID=A0A160TFL4_9ZZZZ
MRTSNAIKTAGYMVSIASVMLLGIASWKSASREPLLMICLFAGMTASAVGMLLRWISYQIREREE